MIPMTTRCGCSGADDANSGLDDDANANDENGLSRFVLYRHLGDAKSHSQAARFFSPTAVFSERASGETLRRYQAR